MFHLNKYFIKYTLKNGYCIFYFMIKSKVKKQFLFICSCFTFRSFNRGYFNILEDRYFKLSMVVFTYAFYLEVRVLIFLILNIFKSKVSKFGCV